MNLLGMRGRIVAGVGVFLGIICIFYFRVYLPQMKYKDSLIRSISQENRKLSQLEQKVKELERLKEENQKILQNLSFLEKKLQRTQVSFLYELGVRGKVYGIEYLSILPLPGVKEEYYFRTPIKIHLYGRYHNLGMLLSDMARRGGMGIFSVESIWLKTLPQEEYTIEANLDLSLYEYGTKVSLSQGKSKKSSLASSESKRRTR